MRKRELQSINLKLAELKEYEFEKTRRAVLHKISTTPFPDTTAEPIANVGPKTKKDIQQRIGSMT